jgi:NAD-dependent deacetylase
VLRFYDMRRAAIQEKAPNAAHRALARLEREWPIKVPGGSVTLVTQNVDDLHLRAGSERLIAMHGQHLSAWCTACDTRHAWTGPLIDRPPCPACAAPALRPDIVWFGEVPYRMDDSRRDGPGRPVRVDRHFGRGLSAAGFVRLAREIGAETLELNLERSQGSAWFHETRLGPATQIVPDWVDELLKTR